MAKGSDVEQAITVGLHGVPQLRPDEQNRFLGSFRERVLAAITKEQAGEPRVQKEIEKAMKDPRARAVLAHMDVSFTDVLKYSQLAKQQGLSFTRKSDPSFKGEIGLIVISDDAVNGEG